MRPDERVFDRVVRYDERSRDYNAARLVELAQPRSYWWKWKQMLDQGNQPACVGHGVTHEYGAKPKPHPITSEMAFSNYHRAELIDEFPGEQGGTSVLAGVQVGQQDGWWDSYYWGFDTHVAINVISRHGPGIAGVIWKAGMMRPDSNGFIHPTGYDVGGHCVCFPAVNATKEFVVVLNSWTNWSTTEYGPQTAKMTWDDFDVVLHNQGEICFPQGRH